MPSYVVAGASRGLGIAFIRQLSSNPANIVFGLVRNKNTAKDAIALEQEYSNLRILQADITDLPALEAAAAEVSKAVGGKLNYLINNAAFLEDQRNFYDIVNYPVDHFDEDALLSFKTNVLGVVKTINAFLPLLEAAAIDSVTKVVTLSTGMADTDMAANFGIAVASPYAISKAALNMAVAKYAAKYKDTNLGFLAISPGVVNTAVRPPTNEQLESFGALLEGFQSIYPDFTGPITPEVSVKMMLDVIDHWDVKKDNGAFISHKGNKEWL